MNSSLFLALLCNALHKIYARANPEVKRKAIERASANVLPKEIIVILHIKT